jgi:hypothetical protein
MIPFDEAFRLVRIRERIRNATYHELQKDGHHKSGEGAMSISFNLPAIFGDEKPYWAVEAYSYVLCPEGRSKTWIGQTAAEAIAKAEDDVAKWCFEAEMEQFSGRFDPPEDGDDGPDVPQDEQLPL